MAIDIEQRKLLNQQLLRAARDEGNVEELLTSDEYRDSKDPNNFNFLFDINCTDLSGNTPLHLAVLGGSIDHVNLLIEANGCDVDPQNNAGDTPLHLAVTITDWDTRLAIVTALVVDAEAIDSIRLTNKAGQTPNDLAKIYWPNDEDVSSLTTPPVRKVNDILDDDDFASGDEEDDSDFE